MKKTKNAACERKLKLLNQSRERELMPRPTVFKDKSKYSRKGRLKRICAEME